MYVSTSKTSVIRVAIVLAEHTLHPQNWTVLGDKTHLIMAWHKEMELSSKLYCCQVAVTIHWFWAVVSVIV
jgi:hypothetical protein